MELVFVVMDVVGFKCGRGREEGYCKHGTGRSGPTSVRWWVVTALTVYAVRRYYIC